MKIKIMDLRGITALLANRNLYQESKKLKTIKFKIIKSSFLKIIKIMNMYGQQSFAPY